MHKMTEAKTVEQKVKIFVEWLTAELKNGKGDVSFFVDCRILIVKYFKNSHATHVLKSMLDQHNVEKHVNQAHKVNYRDFLSFIDVCYGTFRVYQHYTGAPLSMKDPFVE